MLKPCPFCGCTNVEYSREDISQEHGIECFGCGFFAYFDVDLTDEEAVRLWNRRKSAPVAKHEKSAYIARKPCGCCVGMVSDEANKFTADAVGEFIRSGLHIERVGWDECLEVRAEPTFLDCPHTPEKLQPNLFNLPAA